MRSLCFLLLALFLMVSAGPRLHAANEPPSVDAVFFTGVVGEDSAAGRRVLLRWITPDPALEPPFAVIFRSAPGVPREKVSVVSRMRDEPTILALFNQPGNERFRQDMNATIDLVFGTGQSADPTFAARLIQLLEGTGGTGDPDGQRLRRLFLTSQNAVAAVIDGIGYLDVVPSAGPWTYELWAGDAAGNAVQALGKVTLNAASRTTLPAPANVREVLLKSRNSTATPSAANHRRVYLAWDSTPAMAEQRFRQYGYEVYRLGRALAPGETFESLLPTLDKLTDFPLLDTRAPTTTEDGNEPYQFADWGEALVGGELLPAGSVQTYFVAARDLFGQPGAAGSPITTAVMDTLPPETPRGVSVARQNSEDAANAPRLLVTWDPPADAETVAYRVYRVRDYANLSKDGPFAPIAGLTEGLIGENILPAASGPTTFTDVAPATAPNVPFWYTVTAIDADGNESAPSAPAVGSIDRLVGPTVDVSTVRICSTGARLSASGFSEVEAGLGTGFWSAEIDLGDDVSPGVIRIDVERLPSGGGAPVVVGSFDLSSGARPQPLSDQVPGVTTLAQAPSYRIIAIDFAGNSSDPLEVPPPTGWVPTARAAFTVSAIRTEGSDCAEGDSGLRVVESDSNGAMPPVTFTIERPELATSLRLFRSVDGADYSLVGTFTPQGDAFNLVDTLTVESMGTAQFMVQALDSSGNPGPPVFMQTAFTYIGTPPQPTLISVTRGGTVDTPVATVRWSAPKQGVAYFQLSFQKAGATEPEPPINLSAETTTFDAATNTWTATTSVVDSVGTPLDTNMSYQVRVGLVTQGAAVLTARARAPRSSPNVVLGNSLIFSWVGQASAGTTALRWPFRPITTTVAPPDPTALYREADGAVFLQLTTAPLALGAEPNWNTVRPPFMVWRRRTDKGGQPFVAISPLLESVRTVPGAGGVVIDDPFFATLDLGLGQYVYFTDRTSLVAGATYEYLILVFQNESFEPLTTVGGYSATLPND